MTENYKPIDFLDEKAVYEDGRNPFYTARKDLHYGDVFWVDIHFTTDIREHKVRPCIIFQNEREIANSNYVTVIPMTSNVSRADMDTHVVIADNSIAMIESMTTVPKCLIQKYHSHLNKSQIQEVKIAVQKHLGIL